MAGGQQPARGQYRVDLGTAVLFVRGLSNELSPLSDAISEQEASFYTPFKLTDHNSPKKYAFQYSLQELTAPHKNRRNAKHLITTENESTTHVFSRSEGNPTKELLI